jgi:acetyl esterase/lipase
LAYAVSTNKAISYGPLSHQKLDRYTPSGPAGEKPGMVMITGGSFSRCLRTNMADRCQKVASELGVVCVTIKYAVPGDGGYAPQTFADVALAVQWLKSQSNVIDDRVGVWGYSAGANLAAHAALATGGAKLLVGESGPYNIDPPSAQATVNWLNGYSAHDASPIFFVDAGAKPAILAHGTADTTVPYQESVDMKAAYDAAGVPCILHPHSGGHGGPTTIAQINALWAAQKAFLQANL